MEECNWSGPRDKAGMPIYRQTYELTLTNAKGIILDSWRIPVDFRIPTSLDIEVKILKEEKDGK